MSGCIHEKHLPLYMQSIKSKSTNKEPNPRYNAFTSKSYMRKRVHTIGKPPKSNYREPEEKGTSKFRGQFLRGEFPFIIDHSAHSFDVRRLAWKMPIQDIAMAPIFPKLIEGLTDSEQRIRNIAMLAVDELLKHATIFQMVSALSSVRVSFQKLFGTRQPKSILCGLQVLRKIVLSLKGMGTLLTPTYRDLLIPLNFFYNRFTNMNDSILYDQFKHEVLRDAIDRTLTYLETYAGGCKSQWEAYRNIKGACSSYESAVFPLRVVDAQVEDKRNGILNQPLLVPEYGPGIPPKPMHPSIRLIDVNYV